MNYLKAACKYMRSKGITIATAESCTGGMIASDLVSIPGISECFSYGYVTYSNAAKEEVLGVRNSTLTRFGAVSCETAREMAKYVRAVANADIGLSSTGIAGPGGGSAAKPVGLVYISCAIDNYVITRKYIFKGSRFLIRLRTTKAAEKLLYEMINKYRP